jgi:predicted DNA-binding protein
MDKELKNKIDFINQKTGKKTGFSIPENYFEEMEDNFFSSIATESLPKDDAFKTPSNYFETVENDILSKLNIETDKEVKVISLYKRVLNFIPIAAAASVLLFIGLNYFNTSKTYTFDDITEADIASWYENGYGNTNNDELAMVLDSSDFEEDILPSIEDDNLEDYLNTVDDSILLNEIQ